MFRRSLLAATVFASLAGASMAQPSGPVQVGAVEILSGPNAAYGTAIKAGLELALDEINQKGRAGRAQDPADG